MNVAIIGTGYVGLVTGACLARFGHSVTCVDADRSRVARLRGGEMPFYEPGLEELTRRQMAEARLSFTSEYAQAVPTADAVFICVGTPPLSDGRADTSFVASAARSIGQHLSEDYTVVINKSTVPIGSGDWVGMLVRQGLELQARERAQPRNEGRSDDGALPELSGAIATLEAALPARFDVVSNPEFLREGTAISDTLQPDRIVVGADTESATTRMRALYGPLLEHNADLGREVPFVVTDRASAEMIKYAANAFLATKISFINEMANICERVGADVTQVAQGIGLDHRIGRAFLSAGLGWGGSCFPKDLAALAETAREYDYNPRLLEAVQNVNRSQRALIIRKLQERLKLVKGKTVALWGLSFKPNTDDLRDAPALWIASRLEELGAEVRAYDPQAMEHARHAGLAATLCPDPYAAAAEADAVVLVTEWPEFAALDWERLKRVMRRPLVVDGRNALDRAAVLWHGFEYCGIGR